MNPISCIIEIDLKVFFQKTNDLASQNELVKYESKGTFINVVTFFLRSLTCCLPNLHLSLHFQLLRLFLSLVFLDLLGCKFVYVACWQTIFANCSQKQLVSLKKSCIFNEVIIAFCSLNWFWGFFHLVYDGCIQSKIPLLFYFCIFSFSA